MKSEKKTSLQNSGAKEIFVQDNTVINLVKHLLLQRIIDLSEVRIEMKKEKYKDSQILKELLTNLIHRICSSFEASCQLVRYGDHWSAIRSYFHDNEFFASVIKKNKITPIAVPKDADFNQYENLVISRYWGVLFRFFEELMISESMREDEFFLERHH